MLRQAGVALVSVLLVVAIATVLAVSMIQEQYASIQISRGYLSRTQANQYALGGEELARQMLYADFEKGNGIDYIGETWSDPDLHFEFDDGEVSLRITDQQGLVNLNSIGDKAGLTVTTTQRLRNLVFSLGGDPSLIDRLQDWLDSDTSSRPAGAEDFDYLLFEPPYRSGNGPMAHASETRLIGLLQEQYDSILPYVTALPAFRTQLNINSAPISVLQSLSPQLTTDLAGTIAAVRAEEEGFESVEEFLQLPQLAGLGVSADGLGVQSEFFEARIIARYQDRYSYLTSVIYRDATTGQQSVLRRSFLRNFRSEATNKQTDG